MLESPQSPKPETDWLRRIGQSFVRLFAWLSIAICVPTLLAVGARWSWFCELAVHFRAYYAIVLIPCGLLLFAFRQRKFAMPVAACGLFNAMLLLPLYSMGSQQPSTASATSLRGMSVNVLTSNRRFDLLAEQIGEERPDFLLLLEVNQAWLEALSDATADYPHQITRPRDDNFGIAFFSRLPVESLEIQTLGDADVPSVVAELRLEGQTVTVIGTHTLPPIGSRRAAARNRQLADVAALARDTPGPVLVIGDLNATPWSPDFHDLLQTGNLHDGRRGIGILPTWTRLYGLLQLPIDHLLVGEHLFVQDMRIGPPIGSDHRPMVFDVVLVESINE